MAKGNVRVSDWWFLCRHAGFTILLVVIGIGSAGAWMAGQGFGKDIPQWATPIVALVATGMGAWLGRFLFLECAPVLEFGDQFKFRMLFGGGTRKWANVKSVTLIWETGASDDQRLYRTVEVKLKGGKKLVTGLNEESENRLRRFGETRLRELGVQFIDKM